MHLPEQRPEDRPGPPLPPRRPHVLVAHGDQRIDDWYWLQDGGDPQVRAHLEAENAYCDAVLSPASALQQRVYSEIKGRFREGDVSAPARKGDWWYYDRTVAGLQYAMHCRRHDPGGVLTTGEVVALAGKPDEHVILDENRLAGTSPYFALNIANLSPDQSMIAFATDRTGSEVSTLRFRDLGTDTTLDDMVDDVYYSSAWSADSRSFFYVRVDDTMRPHQVWRHVVGRPATDDVVVFEEADQRFFVQVGLTRSERFIVITCHAKLTSEVWFLDAGRPGGTWRVVEPRRQGVVYVVEDAVLPGRGDVWLVLSDDDGAQNFALHHTSLEAPGRCNWELILPHRPDVKLEAVDTFAGHAVVVEREQGLRHLNVIRLADGVAHRIQQPEPVYAVSAVDSLQFDSTVVRFGYTSLVTPQSTIEYDLETRVRTLVKQEPVVGGYRAENYETDRVWAEAPDGTKVPISLVRQRLQPRDGRAPCLLYGYGAYGVAIEPTFSSTGLSLLERGFMLAIAHVRGGGELGRHWHDEGKLLRKRNSFTDFIACAEHLVDEGYTSPGRLVIRSRSAGGLLVGAVTNLRPDLFAGVVAEVPFVDIVTTMLDESLPLTVTEQEEWGAPAQDTETYAYMKSYSPYDNVAPVVHPAILATGALHDQRVAYWEPAKWVAKLRNTGVGDRPLLLRTEVGVGHGGPSGRYRAWLDEARIQAFILTTVDIDQ